jgi:phage gp29-like protein
MARPVTPEAQSLRYMGLGLGVGYPQAPVPTRLDERPAYVPNFSDRLGHLTQDQVKVERIESALNQASIGYLYPFAELNDLVCTHPIVKGLKRHLKAAIKRVQPQVNPPANVIAGRAELAQTIANDVRREIENNADAPISGVVGDYVECDLRGGGLIEILWKRTPDNRWHWVGFELVPQQRHRFDQFTGESCFAQTAPQYLGEPVSSFLRGTFIVVKPDKAVPDFSKRGTLRAILTDWFACQNSTSWWQDDLERLGSPIIAASFDNDADREVMNETIKNMGSNGGVTYRKGGEVKLVEKQSRTGPKGSPHNEFETTRIQRMSIAFLGAAGTISADSNTGSENSSDNMTDVADSVVAEYWEAICADLRRDLYQVFVELNYGLENSDLTPIMGVDLEEAADASTTLDAYTKGGALGVPVGDKFARKKLKWPEPGPGEKPLVLQVPEPAPPETASAVGAGGGPRSVPAPSDGAKEQVA